jgi:hypothetical protein
MVAAVGHGIHSYQPPLQETCAVVYAVYRQAGRPLLLLPLANLQAPREQLSRTVYNVQGMSICPRELATAIAEHVPGEDVTDVHTVG